MPQTGSRTSPGVVLGAVVLGFVLAVVTQTVFTLLVNVIYSDPSAGDITALRAVNMLGSVIVGVAVAAPLFLVKPSGPLAPILTAPASVVGAFIGILIAITVHSLYTGPFGPMYRLELYFEGLPHMDMWGVFSWLLIPLVAVGLAVLRVLLAGGGRQSQGGWPGPHPAFAQPQPGQFPPPGQPGQPGQFAPPE